MSCQEARRAGLVTSAGRAGVPERAIMRQTGHKSIEKVLNSIRQANAFPRKRLERFGALTSVADGKPLVYARKRLTC